MATFIQQSNTDPVGGAPTSAFDDDPKNPNRYRPVNQGGSAYDFRAAGFGQPTSAIPNAGVPNAVPEEQPAAGGGVGDGSILEGIQAEDPAARDRQGGVAHTQDQQEAQLAGGKIDDFGNFIDASLTGSSAVPGANVATAIPGALSFGYNMATGAFSQPYGNWNTIPGFEDEVKKRLGNYPSVTAAQNAVAAEMKAKGIIPEGYVATAEDVAAGLGGFRNAGETIGTTKAPTKDVMPQNEVDSLVGGGNKGGTPAPNNQTNQNGITIERNPNPKPFDQAPGTPTGTVETSPVANPNAGNVSGSNGGGGAASGGNQGGNGGYGTAKGGGLDASNRGFESGGYVGSRYAAGGTVLDEIGTQDAAAPQPAAAPAAPPPSMPMTPAAQALPPAQQQARFAPQPHQVQSDGITDNQPIMADEGEYMINRESAQILGPELLNLLNDPMMAKTIKDMMDSMLDEDDETDVSPIDSDFDSEPQGLYAVQ